MKCKLIFAEANIMNVNEDWNGQVLKSIKTDKNREQKRLVNYIQIWLFVWKQDNLLFYVLKISIVALKFNYTYVGWPNVLFFMDMSCPGFLNCLKCALVWLFSVLLACYDLPWYTGIDDNRDIQSNNYRYSVNFVCDDILGLWRYWIFITAVKQQQISRFCG